ncbi:MAG: FAD-dependent oxidoreductase [Flavobacteriales bacterium]
MKILIVGGVAGGATAATRLRRLSEKNQIIVFERGAHISFANCGLPYHIGGIIEEREKLLLQTPKSLKDRFNLDIRVKTEVLSINKEKREVKVHDLETGKLYTESYDKLLLSPGAEPFRPPIEGINSENILTLRNIVDMDRIISKVKTHKKIAVVGGGFIGLEVAENLIEQGVQVTLVELAPQVMAPVDFEIASLLHQHVKEKGLDLKLNTAVQKFRDKGTSIELLLSDKTILEAESVILAIGVKPENKLAKEALLEIGNTGGILVNEYLQTSDENIYAVGDAVEVSHYINKAKVLIPLAWPANRQGRIVADNIMKKNQYRYKGSLGTSILKIFDLNVSTTGLNERVLKKNKCAYQTALVTRGDHAGYYPGATSLILKLIFGYDGTIYGAQSIGKNGVDKRIDVIATAIKGGLKAQDLTDLEIAYAPPFNSAKDPVNIVGYVAQNMLNNDLQMLNYDQVAEYQDKENVVFLDVRTLAEHNVGAIKNSLHIDLNTLRENLNQLDQKKTYVVYCKVGLRGYLAYNILKQNGFKVLNLNGGYSIWKSTLQ